MLGELKRLREVIRPTEILLVADGMTGQEAVTIAKGWGQPGFGVLLKARWQTW